MVKGIDVAQASSVVTWTDWVQAIGSIATALALFVAIFAALNTWDRDRKTAEQDRVIARQNDKAAEEARARAAKFAEQNEAFLGALSAIAWREQVFKLHDRGLTPGQIRFIMHLEGGGAGYEGWNGRIDDIVGNLPRLTTIRGGVDGDPVDAKACPDMPTLSRPPKAEAEAAAAAAAEAAAPGHSCEGPCVDALRLSGCAAYRVFD